MMWPMPWEHLLDQRHSPLKNAVIVAAICEFAGAFLVGGHVTDTVRKGLFDPSVFEPTVLILGLLASLFAAAIWLNIATILGLPVSTTHSIVGALIGFAAVVGGIDTVEWAKGGSGGNELVCVTFDEWGNRFFYVSIYS